MQTLRPFSKQPASEPAAQRWQAYGGLAVAGLLLALVFLAGLELRRATWRWTEDIRYVGDTWNGFYWGSEVVAEGRRLSGDQAPESAWEGWVQFARGYHGMYDRVTNWYWDGRYYLDYPPLRLLVMGLWAKHVLRGEPELKRAAPEHTRPLRFLNLACEVFTAAGIFLLVAIVRDRAGLPWLGAAGGSALLAWLNPALILDAHGWPQWDVWLLPGFVLGAICAVTGRWFGCGIVLALAGMLKGQTLLVAPFFLLWPLFRGNFRGTFYLLSGFGTAVAAVAAHWLAGSWLGLVWAAAVAGAAAWIWTRVLPAQRMHAGAVAASAFSITLFLAPLIFSGSYAWVKVGILFGTRNYELLALGYANNLAGLMADWGWTLRDTLLGVPLGRVLQIACLSMLVICAAAAARRDAERDCRLLLGIAAPWLIVFALLGQMHERYLMWGAVMTAVGAAFGWRGLLAHLLISLVAMAMILHVMLARAKVEGSVLLPFLQLSHPHVAWLVLAVTAGWMWMMCGRGRRRVTSIASSILRT